LSALYTEIYQSVYSIAFYRPYVGLKEAAYWIREHASPGTGVMTMSQGSAQHVFSLYGRMDSYPFGSFNLYTILPGGGSIAGPPPPDPLIQNGTVDYLVHYVSDTVDDDPFHVKDSLKTQSRFLNLIQKYDSLSRYVYVDEYVGLNGTEIHEPRAWVFEVGKLLPKPELEVESNGTTYNVIGKGFMIGSNVSIFYDSKFLREVPTDATGSVNDFIEIPEDADCGKELLILDNRNNIGKKILECR
jgi:hypothetical protein